MDVAWRHRGLWLLLISSPLGCGGGLEGGVGDAGPAVDDGGDAGVQPRAPAPPQLAPCAPGFREVLDGEGPATCEPWPEEGRVDCPQGQAHFVGEPGCRGVGRPCPASDFPTELPADRVVIYVRPGVPGDGTEPTPFDTLAAAVAAVPASGAVIALSRGEHTAEVTVELAEGVELWGACAELTVIRSSTPTRRGLVTTGYAATGVRDLRLEPGPRPGFVSAGPDGDMHLEGVVVEDAELPAVGIITRGRLSARDLVVRRMRPGGRALSVGPGSVAEIRSAVFASLSADAAVYASGFDTRLILEDFALHDAPGRGLQVQAGARLELSRAALEGAGTAAVVITNEGTTASLDQVLVRETGADVLGEMGHAVHAGHSSVQVRRSHFDRSTELGVLGSGEGAALDLEDVLITGTRPRPSDDALGRGLNVVDGASVTGSRIAVEDCTDVGVFLSLANTSAVLGDLAIRRTVMEPSDPTGGRGLGVQTGAVATLERLLLEDNEIIGLFAGGDGARAEGTEVTARGGGRGIAVELAGSVQLGGLSIEQVTGVAIYAHGAASALSLERVVVRDTRSRSDGRLGRALSVHEGATVEIRGGHLSGSRELGVAVGDGGSVRLFDLELLDTWEADCAHTTCTDTPLGTALVAAAGGGIEAERFRIAGAPLCGAHVGPGGSIDLRHGEVSGTGIGACVGIEGYDVSRLTEDVRYVDNGVNLQSITLPVPEPAAPLGEAGPAGEMP